MNKTYKIFVTILLATIVSSAPTPIDANGFTLTTDMSSLEAAVNAVDEALSSRRLTIGQLMDGANREREGLCNGDAYSPLTAKSGDSIIGFCWQSGDDAVAYWVPQGITTTRDASDSGQYDEHQLIVVSWYNDLEEDQPGTPDKGTRLSFVDWDADWPNTYRHVLLVEPTDDGDFKAVPIHAGGIAWYGNLIYVVDTYNGFRIFDVEHIYQTDTDNRDVIGKSGDNYYAYGYGAIMLQTGSIANTGANLRYSFTCLDKATDPPSLIVGEYASGEEEAPSTQVVRFPLNATSYLPSEGDNGTTSGSEAYDTGFIKMQGAVARDGFFWFGSSSGGGGPEGNYGILRFWERNSSEVSEHEWIYGPEDMTYWADPENVDYLFTLSEYQDYRTVVGAPQADWHA